MTKVNRVGFGLLMSVIMLSACNPNQVTNEKLIAQVYSKKLYESEANQNIPAGVSAQDSLLLRNTYIERWIRDNLMMVEAERNLPPDLALEELVEDYRASMIKHQYEKQLVERLLDTVINDAELQAYYNENKAQYILESVIVRCRFIKLGTEVPSEDRKQIEELWTSNEDEERQQLLLLTNEHADPFFLSDSTWYTLDAIRSIMPPGSVNDAVIRNNREVMMANDQGYYFLKILEVRDEEEIAPLIFIEQQASKVILHKRKLELLEKIKEDLYDRASTQNRIKIYTG